MVNTSMRSGTDRGQRRLIKLFDSGGSATRAALWPYIILAASLDCCNRMAACSFSASAAFELSFMTEWGSNSIPSAGRGS